MLGAGEIVLTGTQRKAAWVWEIKNMSVLTGDDHVQILISETEITARVNQLAKQITETYSDTDQLVVVGLLRGSFIFIADLVRRLNLPVEVDFMTVSSYGDKTETSRQVTILKDLETNIRDRDVLVVEDIIDTGHTLAQVLKIINQLHLEIVLIYAK